MPMPHQDMRRLIKRRISGLDGAERIQVLKGFLAELPGYYQGPYGELRKWVLSLIDESQVRKAVRHQDQFFIPKEGAAQVVLVGPPNAGKSSLLKTLTGRQVSVGDYPFTTLRPVAGMLKLAGAVVQLVDLPGLLRGAVDGKGGGRAVVGCIRMADAVLFVSPLTAEGVADFRQVYEEVTLEAGISLAAALVGTKADLDETGEVWTSLAMGGGREASGGATVAGPAGLPTVRCSTATGEGLDDVRRLVWDLCGLKRAFSKPRGKPVSPDAVVLPPGATVEDFIAALNRAWLDQCQQARVTGTSARFAGQAVGLDHVLADGDVVELVLR
ncbi:MAG: GTPase [Symbiobacteriia bacterium]